MTYLLIHDVRNPKSSSRPDVNKNMVRASRAFPGFGNVFDHFSGCYPKLCEVCITGYFSNISQFTSILGMESAISVATCTQYLTCSFFGTICLGVQNPMLWLTCKAFHGGFLRCPYKFTSIAEIAATICLFNKYLGKYIGTSKPKKHPSSHTAPPPAQSHGHAV
jgi:hypothetical protein